MPADYSGHSIESEQMLLGALLMNNAALGRVQDIVRTDDFFEPVHQAVFEIITDLVNAGRLASPVTIRPFVPKDQEITGGVTISQYLSRLAAHATTVLNAPDFAQVVRDMADRRRLSAIGERLVLHPGGAALDHPIDPLAAEVVGDLDAILTSRVKQYAPQVSMAQSVAGAVDAAATAYQRNGQISGVTWGLRAMDQKTLGMHGGELIIAAGRPGMGKSAVAVTVGRRAAAAGHKVLFVSLEMGDIMLSQRALADELFDTGPLSYYRIKSGRFTEADFARITEAARRLALLPLTIEQRPALSIGQISAIARQRKRQHGLDLLIIDHLHLVRASDRYRGNRVAEVGEVSNGLKAIAKDLGVPVLALCQLSRQVEAREIKRPTLADLRWAGEIEQDADTVVMLYRESYYQARDAQQQTDDPGVQRMQDNTHLLEAIFEKQRQGPTGPVKLFCNIECNAVRDLSDEMAPSEGEPVLF